jgi:hypothetical protein
MYHMSFWYSIGANAAGTADFLAALVIRDGVPWDESPTLPVLEVLVPPLPVGAAIGGKLP